MSKTVRRLELTHTELKAKIHYDPDTGVFTRIYKHPTKIHPLGTPEPRYGRIILRLSYGNGKIRNIPAANVAYYYMTGEHADTITFKDDDRTNLRFNNLIKFNPIRKGEELTYLRLKGLMTYNADTGDLFWKQQHGKISDIRNPVELLGSGIYSNFSQKKYLNHRLAWLYTHGEWPKGEIDHINHIRTDNRIVNLRDVTRKTNHMNTSPYKNKTGHIGVHIDKRYGTYYARIKKNGVTKHLGTFETIEEAIKAREQAEYEYNFHENHGKTKEELGI